MKKIFTLMLALACALFVGVSCTPNQGGDGEQYSVTITVADLEVEFPANGGKADLTYTLSSVIPGEVLSVGEPTATWLTVEMDQDGEDVLHLACLANSNSPGSDPREASFTLSYPEAKDVTVTVKQVSQEPSYSLLYANMNPQGADVTVQILNTELAGKKWGLLYATESAMVDWETMAPEDPMVWINKQMEEYILYYGGVSGLFVPNPYMGESNKTLGDSESEPFYCTIGQNSPWGGPTPGTPGDKLYVFVAGIEVDQAFLNYEKETDDTKLLTAVHVFQVPLPVSTISVVGDGKLAYNSEPVSYDVAVEGVYEGSTVVPSVDWSVDWLTAEYADGKLTLTATENTYAIGRSAVVTLNYGSVNEYGEVTPYAKPFEFTVVQDKNPNAENVTFTIEVTETHFDHILVTVTPSNLDATYVLSSIKNFDFIGDYNNNWYDLAVSMATDDDLYHTGVYTGRIKVNDYDASDDDDPESWKHWVYAYAVDNGVVAGEVAKELVAVTNDMPKILMPSNCRDLNGSYVIDVPADGQAYSLKLDVANPVEGGKFYFQKWNSSYTAYLTEYQVSTNWGGDQFGVLGDDRWVRIDNDAKTFNFTANNVFPENWEEDYYPYFDVAIKYADGETGKTTYGYPQTFRIYLTPVAE